MFVDNLLIAFVEGSESSTAQNLSKLKDFWLKEALVGICKEFFPPKECFLKISPVGPFVLGCSLIF